MHKVSIAYCTVLVQYSIGSIHHYDIVSMVMCSVQLPIVLIDFTLQGRFFKLVAAFLCNLLLWVSIIIAPHVKVHYYYDYCILYVRYTYYTYYCIIPTIIVYYMYDIHTTHIITVLYLRLLYTICTLYILHILLYYTYDYCMLLLPHV